MWHLSQRDLQVQHTAWHMACLSAHANSNRGLYECHHSCRQPCVCVWGGGLPDVQCGAGHMESADLASCAVKGVISRPPWGGHHAHGGKWGLLSPWSHPEIWHCQEHLEHSEGCTARTTLLAFILHFHSSCSQVKEKGWQNRLAINTWTISPCLKCELCY